MNLYPRFGIANPFDPLYEHVTSPVVSVRILAILRLLIAVYTLVTLIITLVWASLKDHDADGFFSYFTHLSYIGLCAYFWTSGVHTARAIHAVDHLKYPLQRWPRPLQFLHVLLQTTVTTYPLVVTIVFWILLASPATFSKVESTWSNISVHAMNSLFAVIEVLFTDIPPAPWLMLPCAIILLACYLAVAYITYDTQKFYPYSFLDPKKQGPLLAAYILGIFGGYIAIFLIVRLVTTVRVRIVTWHRERNGGGHGVSVGSEAIEDWEQVERPSKEVGMAV